MKQSIIRVKLLVWLFILILAGTLTACDMPGNANSGQSSPTLAVVNPPSNPPSNAGNPTTTPMQNSIGAGGVNPSQGDHVLFVEPEDGNTPVVGAINAAKNSVEMKMYLLTERDVIAALKAAQQRGIKVRVMLEEHPYGSGPGNTENYKTFQSSGIEVKWTNPVFKLSHEKSLVVDDKAALIMTLNLTHSAFISNREYGIITTKPAEVKEVLDGFNADWNRNAFNPADSSPLLWSNLNSRKKILAFIDGSQKTLILEQEEMQDSEVQQHLIDAAKRGVKVRVLVAGSTGSESSGGDYNKPGEQQIQAGGVQVKTIAVPYMHAKIYLADGNRVIICSENVSTSSLNNNRELGIIVSDSEIVKRVAQTFEKDWVGGKAV